MIRHQALVVTLAAAIASSASAADGPDWQARRAGLHFTLGAAGGALPRPDGHPEPWVGFVAVLPSLRYEAGWWGVDVTAQLLGYFTTFTAGFAALAAEARWHPVQLYSVGLGPYVGAAFSLEPELALGVSVSPVILTLGERGEHELFVWLGAPFVANGLRVLLALAGYRYVF